MTEQHDGVEPIAVIGIACRVPGAADVNQFWHNLVAGVEARTELSRARLAAAGVAPELLDDPAYVPAAFLLDDVPYFDADLFGMTAREAALTDPQHRLFLELTHAAFEDAGRDPARIDGDVGVYGGRGMETYRWRHVYRNRAIASVSDHMSVGIGNHADTLTTLTSYRLGLRGPSVGVYTACSTSLVAVHLAVEALRAGECDFAVAGGVCVELPGDRGYLPAEGGVDAVDGHCRPFDAAASGTVWGSGGGTVLLRRLSDALADGDQVRAVVLGNAINNDGAGKVGFSAPGVDGQAAAISAALAVADVDPRTVSYVEAHGTGTSIGDPIEVTALTDAFRRGSADRQWCALGSVKSNIGHLSQGAGVVGLIKTVLALEHGLIPPSLHFDTPNPAIDFAASPFYVNATLAKWEPTGGQPLRAGVSSFGIGGTNAHVVLEAAPPPDRVPAAGRPVHLLRVSARSEAARDAAVERLASTVDALTLADVAHTLRVGRARHRYRAAVVAGSPADAVRALRKRPVVGTATAPPRVGLLFPGQGSQYAGMGRQLYATEPVFAAAVDRCAEVLGTDPLDGDAGNRTEFVQPALFTVEYALASLWRSWGLEPATMIGHSVGEYVAATLAGVFAVDDAVRLIARRGALMQSLPPGAMLAVAAGEDAVTPVLPDGLSIAAVNGPRACVVAGPTDLVDAFTETLAAQGMTGKRLRTSHAFHSPMMDPVLAEFRAAVAAVPRHPPARPLIAGRTGTPMTAAQATDPDYWTGQLRDTVRFGAGVAAALADGVGLFVECGPGRQLGGLARMQLTRDLPLPVPGLPGPDGEAEAVYAAAGRLWVDGVDVDPPGDPGRRVPLPGYPYERAYHWVDPDPDDDRPGPAEPAATRLPVENWFSVPTWQRLPASLTAEVPASCVLFEEGSAIGDALRKRGVRVSVGEDLEADHFVYALPSFFGLVRLVQALSGAGRDGVTVDVVTSGARQVLGGDLTRPEHALLSGVVRSAPYDTPGIRLRHVDLPSEPTPRDLDALVTELGVDGPDEVALRSGWRWVPGFTPVTVPAPDDRAAGLRRGGVYLITGGLGGIGTAVAEDLAARCGARVVLLGRNVAGAEGTVARIAAAGGTALVLAADVTSLSDLRSVRDTVVREYGRIDGIVHAAGVAGGGVTELRTRAEMEPVLAPKVAGTLALAEVFGADDLDFVVLFSSVVGTVGGFGEVDYCAANAFLDAYAESAPSVWRTPPRSLAWAGWQGTGMLAAVGAATPTDALRRLTPAEGVAAFHRVLAAGLPGHVVVTPIPVEAVRAGQPVVPGERPPEAVERSGPVARTTEEAQLAEIWSAVLGVTAPAPDDNFFELGGNSLVAVQLIAQVRQGFGVKLPMRSIFETPTIASMADRVTELVAARLATADESPRTITRIPRREQ